MPYLFHTFRGSMSPQNLVAPDELSGVKHCHARDWYIAGIMPIEDETALYMIDSGVEHCLTIGESYAMQRRAQQRREENARG